MGADLCISCFWIPDRVDNEQAKKRMLEAVETLTKEDLAEPDFVHAFCLDEDDDKHRREMIIVAIMDTFDSLDGRDVSWIYHKGDRIYLSGGMSYGDAPTDSYDLFYKFGNLPTKVLVAGNINQ
jgi:hypothetical protein